MNYFFTRSSLLFLISFSFSVKKSSNVVIVLHCLYSSVYNTINVIIYASERERERIARAISLSMEKKRKKKNQFDRIEFISYVCVCIFILCKKKKRILSSRNAMTRHDTNIESNRIKANRRRRSDCNYFPPPLFFFFPLLFLSSY